MSNEQIQAISTAIRPPISTIEFQNGTVAMFKGPTGNQEERYGKFYDQGEGHGFLRVEGVENHLFFHITGHHSFSAVSHEKFPYEMEVRAIDDRFPAEVPTHDKDIIVLEIGPGRAGKPAVLKWGFKENMLHAEKCVKLLPRFRFIKMLLVEGKHSGNPEVIWEGTNSNELSKRYKRETFMKKYLCQKDTIRGTQYSTVYKLQKQCFGENGWTDCENFL